MYSLDYLLDARAADCVAKQGDPEVAEPTPSGVGALRLGTERKYLCFDTKEKTPAFRGSYAI